MIRDKLKALVPVIFGLTALAQEIIERGAFTRADASEVLGYVVLGLLVYLVPNLPLEGAVRRDTADRPLPPPTLRE